MSTDTQPKATDSGDNKLELLFAKHENYIKQYADDDSGTDQMMAEHLKMSAIYWGLNALFLMKTFNEQTKDKVLKFIRDCQNSDGGFGSAPKHDSHIVHTLSAVQVLIMLDKCHVQKTAAAGEDSFIRIDDCVNYVKSLQQPDGSFFGDKWGEVDTRFSFCALATLKLLNKFDEVNVNKAAEFVAQCWNEIDGGFGMKPGNESHSAYVYCCVGSLALANRLDLIGDLDQLGQWLSERQNVKSGGLNGRPEKLPDLCYSWWCLASLKMIDKMHLIDHELLFEFICNCQDREQGGFSDRPGNWVDPFHTMFGVASVSLMCHNPEDLIKFKSPEDTELWKSKQKFFKHMSELRDKLIPVNPILCMPQEKLNCLEVSNK